MLCDVKAKYLKISSKYQVIARNLSVFLQTPVDGMQTFSKLMGGGSISKHICNETMNLGLYPME